MDANLQNTTTGSGKWVGYQEVETRQRTTRTGNREGGGVLCSSPQRIAGLSWRMLLVIAEAAFHVECYSTRFGRENNDLVRV